MNALDLLRNQHRETDAIFDELETASGIERKVLFEKPAFVHHRTGLCGSAVDLPIL